MLIYISYLFYFLFFSFVAFFYLLGIFISIFGNATLQLLVHISLSNIEVVCLVPFVGTYFTFFALNWLVYHMLLHYKIVLIG